jgi:vesicle coat complex subunit
MYNKDQIDLKEKACWFYVDAEPISSFREVQNQLSSKDILEKEASLQKILGSIINDENHPDNLMMSAINYLTIVEDIRIKKLLFIFWEVILIKQN